MSETASSPFEGIQLHDGTIFPGFVREVTRAATNRFNQWTYGKATLMAGAHKALDIGDACYVILPNYGSVMHAWIERIDVDECGVDVSWTTKRKGDLL